MEKKTDRNEKGQFVIGHEGREKNYKTPKELQKAVDSYFDYQDDHPLYKTEFHGRDANECKIPIQRPYTIEGLALALGFTNRVSLMNYERTEGYEPYFNIILHAKEKIRNQWIELGIANLANPGFTKFILINNARYQDKSEVDHRSGDRSMQPMNVIVDSKETGDEFKKLVDGAQNNERPSEEQ